MTWEPGEEAAEIHFILRQGSVLVGGSARAMAPGDDEWEEEHVRVPGPGTLEEDQATGIGVAVVRHADGKVTCLNWSHDVQLKYADESAAS